MIYLRNYEKIALAAACVLLFSTSANAQVYTYADGSISTVYTVTQDTGGDIPLASKRFQWPRLPYKADSGDGPRGTQQGYNICNSTTLGPESFCQTAFVNTIEDFCIWGGPFPNVTVGEDEEQLVAYCTTATHGSRVLSPGALKGVQFIKTPDYVEVIGYIDQTTLNLQADDYGGEEDPHGADQRGNPLGGLVYSSAFTGNSSSGSGGSSQYTQAAEWSYFVGSGIFCFKVCDPSSSRDASLCQHTYDRVGCTYNAPADYAAINNTFSSCEGDNQLPVGQYVSDGRTITWRQPAESLGAITSIPYTPAVPATSQCSTYESSSLYAGLASYYSANPGNMTTTGADAAAGGNATAASTTALSGTNGGADTTAATSAAGQTVGAITAAASDVVSSAVSAVRRRRHQRGD